ncbi:MAG: F0F1 ATP synthase subunit A [Geminicoccaceae bacterium]
MADPLHQFEITPIANTIEIAGYDISFTNSALWMVIAAVAIYVFTAFGTRKQALVPGRWQAAVESSYEFLANMVEENAGKEGRKFFPFVFTLFMFILFGNLLGLIPGSFTFTSHIIVTFAMAAVVFIGVTAVGIAKHGLHFFSFFVPHGVPAAMVPIMVPIEVISYLIRPFSLSIRLFVNMTAGHIMLKVFAGFVAAMGIFGILPLAMTVAFTGLEVVIAFLQAYVFTILSCMYLRDAIYLH